jgi:hypothetical protein
MYCYYATRKTDEQTTRIINTSRSKNRHTSSKQQYNTCACTPAHAQAMQTHNTRAHATHARATHRSGDSWGDLRGELPSVREMVGERSSSLDMIFLSLRNVLFAIFLFGGEIF